MTPVTRRPAGTTFDRAGAGPQAATPTPRCHRRQRRRRSRAALGCFLIATLALSGVTLLAADVLWPALRDPEYGIRSKALRARAAENPGRPLVVVVGSSRTGAGLCPAAWEAVRPADAARPDPILFNMGRAGAGAVIQLMTLHRVYADGVRPAVVLIEYWPPYLNAGDPSESRRLAPEQTFPADLPVLVRHFPEGRTFARLARRARLNPVFGLRKSLLLQLVPTWLPWPQRTEVVWSDLDGWGWLPGLDMPEGPSPLRSRWLAEREGTFRPQLRNFSVSPVADRALREAVATARAHGARVGLVFLPESSQFRAWYPAEAERAAREHLRDLSCQLGVPVLDTRDWMSDGAFVDGFHLTRSGAIEFTRRFGPEVAARFTDSRDRR